jgi:hypothetical protein
MLMLVITVRTAIRISDLLTFCLIGKKFFNLVHSSVAFVVPFCAFCAFLRPTKSAKIRANPAVIRPLGSGKKNSLRSYRSPR